LLGSAAMGEKLGLRPRARIVATAVTGSEPTIMLTGIAPAARKALAKAGMAPKDIDLFEINEAFAAVVMRAARDLDIDMARINVNGGAIAMGHPLGATGAIILGTALDELERTGGSTALISLCVGGGMGIATIIERI
jgi:acetyl-CoA C-acetyltransferase